MLTRYQKMWVRVTAGRFKRQEAIDNPSAYFELSFLEDVTPEIIKMNSFNHDEALRMFLEEVKNVD